MKIKIYQEDYVVREDHDRGNVAKVPKKLVEAWRAAYWAWYDLNEQMLPHADKASRRWLKVNRNPNSHTAKKCPERKGKRGAAFEGYCGNCIITGNEEAITY